ncbi:MAG: division/cell wall cluster transcriptional repressor MraZ [Caldicoprobacterales bacterium]|nr:division/cell wall cluster transcriptional repressor MraZ [Clostridiales bacterium]
MFIGEYQHNIDQKGRVFMPAKFREELGDKFVVTKGLDKCLFVYPYEEWKNFEQKLRTLPLTSKEARAFIRFFFAGAAECEADKQGRVLIPAGLREHASLEKELSIIGVSTRVEIWNREAWENYNDDASLDQDAIVEKMAELGI